MKKKNKEKEIFEEATSKIMIMDNKNFNIDTIQAINEKPIKIIQWAIKKGFEEHMKYQGGRPTDFVVRDLWPEDLYQYSSEKEDWVWEPKEKKSGWHDWINTEIPDKALFLIFGVYFNSEYPQLTEKLEVRQGGSVITKEELFTIKSIVKFEDKKNIYAKMKWFDPILIFPENCPLWIKKYITDFEGKEEMGLMGKVIERWGRRVSSNPFTHYQNGLKQI